MINTLIPLIVGMPVVIATLRAILFAISFGIAVFLGVIFSLADAFGLLVVPIAFEADTLPSGLKGFGLALSAIFLECL